ncbi:Kinesin-like protein, partial [Globisporangium splendens]
MPEPTKAAGAAMQSGSETTSSASTSDAEAPPPRRGVSENIQVFIRIRPLIDRETSQERTAGSRSIHATDSQTIEVRTAETTLRCSYDAVFDPSVSQEQVYERVAECTQAFLQGFNATLFAYGQTGSGKSFTMFGAETDLSRYHPGLQKSSAGVIPRAIKDIFASVVQKEAAAVGPSGKRDGVQTATVYCSFVQIYNEQIFDLLRDSNMNAPLEIREDRKNGIYVEGLSEYAVHSVNDCLTLLQCGEQHRAVRSTHMNQVSSRSHSVFQLMLEQRKQDGSVLKSKFNLVDLAGSEKWNSDSMMQHHHISEMTNINLSLHTLGRCIASLSTKTSGSKHVPYRDSKLTRLLQDSLGGNTKTKIIATLSLSMDCIDESISTLKFADRAKQVMVLVRVNEQREIDPVYVEKLQDDLEQLREVVRLLRSSSSSSSNNNSNNADEHDNDLRSRLVRVLNENTELKRQTEKQRQELEQLRRQSGSGGQATNSPQSVELLDLSVQLAKQQLENTLRQLRDASDRFFRFEIEEDELKSIHTKVFQQAPISTAGSAGGATGGQKGTFSTSLTKPKPRTSFSFGPDLLDSINSRLCLRSCIHKASMMRSPGSFTSSLSAANASTVKGTPTAAPDLLYRVRGRGASLSEPSSGSGDWKRDGGTLQNGKPAAVVDVEKELALSRKAIEKQTKLQNWFMEKEKRELLKLQQEQQFLEEQWRAAAEKDAKFYKHAAATKKKLLSAASASSKPSTAEV